MRTPSVGVLAPAVPVIRAQLAPLMPKAARSRRSRWVRIFLVALPFLMAFGGLAVPAAASAAPGINLNLENGEDGGVSTALQLVALLTVLTLAPSILIMMTSFTRIIIVLGFVRNALATPQIPPNQVLAGIALFLTFFVMAPTFNQINDEAIQPLLNDQITEQEAIDRAEAPIREFMFRQVDQSDLELFVSLTSEERPETRADVPTHVLIPAFVISEVKTAFEIGFLIFIPFLIIDMVIASTVMSMGMVMLPPVIISLPFKILLFVLVDGWDLVVESLVRGFF